MIERKETEAQLLTGRLKDEAWEEVAHLPLQEAFRERMRRSAETVRALGLNLPVRDPRNRPLAKTG
jgi:hypothetical protein